MKGYVIKKGNLYLRYDQNGYSNSPCIYQYKGDAITEWVPFEGEKVIEVEFSIKEIKVIKP
jgi:hypothetical protein